MAQGLQYGTTVSIKDSLVTPRRLQGIAECIKGRASWSACTKLSPRLTERRFLHELRQHGLSTLEVGLESLLEGTQQRIRKLCFDCRCELSVVVNYMVGFPWEDPSESQARLDDVHCILQAAGIQGRSMVEVNSFELSV